MAKKNGSLLPPPKAMPTYERAKYVVLPTDLHRKLAIEAARRGYKVREFIIAILAKAMD